jgi:hypothetical protein
MLDNQSRRVKRHPAPTPVIAKNPIRLTGGRLFLLCEASIRLPHTPYHPCDQGERTSGDGWQTYQSQFLTTWGVEFV